VNLKGNWISIHQLSPERTLRNLKLRSTLRIKNVRGPRNIKIKSKRSNGMSQRESDKTDVARGNKRKLPWHDANRAWSKRCFAMSWLRRGNSKWKREE
jgi:hypothetical protein